MDAESFEASAELVPGVQLEWSVDHHLAEYVAATQRITRAVRPSHDAAPTLPSEGTRPYDSSL